MSVVKNLHIEGRVVFGVRQVRLRIEDRVAEMTAEDAIAVARALVEAAGRRTPSEGR